MSESVLNRTIHIVFFWSVVLRSSVVDREVALLEISNSITLSVNWCNINVTSLSVNPCYRSACSFITIQASCWEHMTFKTELFTFVHLKATSCFIKVHTCSRNMIICISYQRCNLYWKPWTIYITLIWLMISRHYVFVWLFTCEFETLCVRLAVYMWFRDIICSFGCLHVISRQYMLVWQSRHYVFVWLFTCDFETLCVRLAVETLCVRLAVETLCVRLAVYMSYSF